MIFACPHCSTKLADRGVRACPTCKRTMTRNCPFCAEEISILATECKYCGETVMPSPGAPILTLPTVAPAAVAPPPPPAPKPEIEFIGDVRHVAWEDRASGGRLKRWWSTWGSLMSPADFWRHAPVEGGHCKPISFAWFPVAQLLTLALPFVVVGTAVACPFSGSVGEKAMFLGSYLALYPLTYVAVALSTIASGISENALL